jgi:hypothetical protein
LGTLIGEREVGRRKGEKEGLKRSGEWGVGRLKGRGEWGGLL